MYNNYLEVVNKGNTNLRKSRKAFMQWKESGKGEGKRNSFSPFRPRGCLGRWNGELLHIVCLLLDLLLGPYITTSRRQRRTSVLSEHAAVHRLYFLFLGGLCCIWAAAPCIAVEMSEWELPSPRGGTSQSKFGSLEPGAEVCILTKMC